jgi:ubiquinone/menaquinone biosynthesis C-methylase UbiE
MKALTRKEILKVYEGSTIAAAYISERFSRELNRVLHDRQVFVVNEMIANLKPERVLEIAPGPGRLTRGMKLQGTLFCLEYNEGMIEQGCSACSGMTRWVRGDGFQLPFSQVFDLVYSFRFVRHFHREDREKLYREIRRVLRPGGYFIMDAVNESVSRPLRQAHPEQYPIYDKLYREKELRAELVGTGLESVELLPVQKYYGWQYRSEVLLGPRANWLNRFVIGALERLPRRAGLEWVVTCRRG